MKTVAFSVPGPPAPWHVFTRWDRSASKARLKAYQELIRVHARLAMQGRHPHDGPVDLSLDFYREIPRSAPSGAAARKRWCQRHILSSPDADNYAKGAQDSMNGLVYDDDKQVIKRQITKGYREEGETVIVVKFL